MNVGIPGDSALWSYLAPQENQTSAWSETADNRQPVNFDPISLSQDIDWNTTGIDIFRNPPNSGGTFNAIDDTFPVMSTPSPNTFERSGSFDYPDTVRAEPSRQPNSLTHLVASQDLLPPWQMPTPCRSHSSFLLWARLHATQSSFRHRFCTIVGERRSLG
ncbi:hypothetical protein F5148DRAFT_1213927 [Russula earlei]|uniref:Uncharacterized protein n=1 Tax=Russula earlei TaxID=71964 RepID=A0ACC0U3X4_9AGAM|nr:hypothetical protein F5148DRAFT_1213927 [Russula earlei]